MERVILILGAGFLLWLWSTVFRKQAVLSVGFPVAVLGVWVAGYVQFGLLGDPMRIVIPIALAGLAAAGQSAWETNRERRRVRSIFSRYVSADVVDSLLSDPDQPRLGGETRDISIMMVDVRGFTTITERLTAPELVIVMNRFMDYCSTIILEHQGTIDKFIGDSVLAFWNAPLGQIDHADRACEAAQRIAGGLDAFKDELQAANPEIFEKIGGFEIGIGVNTGSCAVGNMGSEKHSNYTVLGDPVNVAARLEGLTKSYGVRVIVGAATVAMSTRLAFEKLDRVQVRGRTATVEIFSPIDKAS